MKLRQHNIKRAAQVKAALETNSATEVNFCGTNYTTFSAAIEPSFVLRAEYELLLAQLENKRQAIANADEKTAEATKRMINGILCHADYGPNSPLWVSSGFVAHNQRNSGLTRPGNVTPATPSIPPQSNAA